MSDRLTLAAPCLFGLESVLAGEMRRLGMQDVTARDGRVTCKGTLADAFRLNLQLRTAERVLIDLASFEAKSFEALFQGVKAVPWEDFIGSSDAFPVKGWSLHSVLHSVPDCQSIVKKAVVERLRRCYPVEWFEETGPVRQIQFAIHKDQVTLSLDTSGPGLHKRGYRQLSAEAPIKETLAAGIVDLAHVRGDTVVCDPFCGSGTLVIEAALHALRIPPGIGRRFQLERWGQLPQKELEGIRQEAIAGVRRDAGFAGYASDIDEAAVRLTRENAAKAGIVSRLTVWKADIADFLPPRTPATILCNPPYGERLMDVEQARALYRTMGRVLDREDVSLYVITPDEEFERIFGRPATRRRKLYNGMIRCQLYMYFAAGGKNRPTGRERSAR